MRAERVCTVWGEREEKIKDRGGAEGGRETLGTRRAWKY